MKQHIKTLIAGGVLALVLIGMAMRGPLEDGYAAYQRGDYAKVMRLFLPLADQGNATAQNNLGVMYRDGSGVSQDYAQALEWYRKAADQGEATALFNLGVMYDNRRGVSQDYAQAFAWYRKAADLGNANAQSIGGLIQGEVSHNESCIA
jgi:uncharacterized protein